MDPDLAQLALIATTTALRNASEDLILARRCLQAAGLTGTDWLTDWAVIAADLAHELDNIQEPRP